MRFPKALSLVACLPIAGHARAATGDQLRAQSDRQQQVCTQTAGVADQIDGVISEFERNHLGGADVSTLKSIRDVLGTMNRDQMQRVVTLLQQAAGTPAADSSAGDVKQAFVVQQDIIGQFRKLLVEYQRQQGLVSLADRIAKLADRQALNLRNAVELAVAKANKESGATDAALQAQQSEQGDIASDAADAVAAARAMAHDASGDAAARLYHALSDASATTAIASSKAAAGDLQTGNIFHATADEKIARDALRTLAEQLVPPKDATEEKQQQLAALDAVSQKQQELHDQTTSVPENHAPDQQPLRPIAREQAATVDATDDVKRKLANISPKAAAALDNAEAHMQEARGDLNAKNRRPAAEEQLKAKVDVDKARRQLQQEIAAATPAPDDGAAKASPTSAASPAPDSPAAAVASAKDLAARIKQLRQAQQNASADTPSKAMPSNQKSDRQQSIADATQQLQQQSADTPAAADPLGQAARQMQQAIAALKQSNTAAAAQRQQAADESLAKAQSAAEAKAKDLQQAQQELGDLEKAQQQIAQLAQKQAEVATSPTASSDPQQQLANETTRTQTQLPTSAKAAAIPMSQAAGHMGNAATQLKQSGDARNAQEKAIGSLAEAAAKVNQAMDEAKAQLGLTPDAQAAEKATAAVEQAAKQLEQARAAMDQPGSSNPEHDLQSAAASAAKAMTEGNDAEQKTQLEQAIGEMAKAADAARQQQPEPARRSMAKAAAALAQADSSMPSMAQSTVPQQHMASAEAKPTTDAPASGDHAAEDGGQRNAIAGANSFVQLPARDRAALEQSQSEKYPQEYGPLVEQYLRNLSDASGK